MNIINTIILGQNCYESNIPFVKYLFLISQFNQLQYYKFSTFMYEFSL